MKKFWFHYNKPKTLKNKKVTMTVHYDKKCYFVHGIDCMVPTNSKIRKEQPVFVMEGKCNKFIINNDIAKIE